MEKKSVNPIQIEKPAQPTDRKIEGELTLDELSVVVGGVPVSGPIYNGSYYPRFKSRFGNQ